MAFDDPDRLTDDVDMVSGYTSIYGYDVLGRTSTLPAADAVGIGSHHTAVGDMALGYYSNDMVASQAQGSGVDATTIAFGLDPDQDRVLTEATTTAAGTKTLTNHYDDASDETAWTSTLKTDGTTVAKRCVDGIDGNLAATVADDGTVKLDLANLHGDTVATIDPDATSIGSYHETTEYGPPRDAASAADDYGWLGAKKRSSNDLGGLTLMGVRLYNPATGRFLSVDPIPGGNANAYTYPTDPINGYDLTGMQYEADGFCPSSSCGKKPSKAKSSPKKEKSKSCGLGCHLSSAGAHTAAKVTGGALTIVHAVKHVPKLVKSVVKVNRGSDLGAELGEWKDELSHTLENAKDSPGYPSFSGMSSALGGLLLGYGYSGHRKDR